MLKIFTDKRYSGFVWHLLFAGVFIGLSLIFIEFTEGIMWYLISSVLRIIFGIAILIVSTRLFSRKALDILSFRNCKRAHVAGCGFLLFFLYYVLTVASGFGKVTGLTAGILALRIILQQATTGFYEEMNYRFLLLEGLKHTRNTVGMKILFVMTSTVLFGLLHCVTGWDTYRFLQTAAIGFAFAVIFVRSGNIVFPMILHFVYDIIANTVPYVEWNHNPVFDNISSVFEVMLVFMFIISAVLLFLPEKKAGGIY